MKTFKLSIVALGAVCALVTVSPVWAATTWITIGEQARVLLTEVAPNATTLSSRSIDVTVPARRGASSLVRGTEVVHAVELDDGALENLSQAVHERLHRCGGFMRHDSAAEALAVLHRLQAPAEPQATAPSYAIDNAAQVTALLPQMQASNILATIQTLSDFQNRKYNSSHGVAASNWLFNNWSQLRRGYRNARVTQIAHTGFAQKSVMLEILGSNGTEAIVIGAHLDSTASGGAETSRAPGADDDASGVATLTELIRVLLSNNYTPTRTIRFIAYAAEEVGLLGSKQIVAALTPRTKVVGVMQLDMTAYQGDPTDLWIYTDYTDAAQNQFVANLAAAYLPTLTVGYDRCGYGCSDHASWYAKGYAVSFPFEASDAHYNFLLHTPNDTIATFGGQANHALKFGQLALAFTVELASDGVPLSPTPVPVPAPTRAEVAAR